MEKKNLATMALTALMLASSLPAVSHAETEVAQGTLLARSCGANSCGSCGAYYSTSRTDETYRSSNPGTGYGSSNSYRDMTGYGTKSYRNADSSYDSTTTTYRSSNTGATGSYSGSYNDPSYSNSTYSNPTSYGSSTYNRPNSSTMSDDYSTGASSYQGTTTGPGPNGGYPGTPRGSYNTNNYNR
jgi:hypothetical protein